MYEPNRLRCKALEHLAWELRQAAVREGTWRDEPVARCGRYPRMAVMRALAGKRGRPPRPNDQLYTTRAARAARKARCDAERLERAARRLTEQAGRRALTTHTTHTAA